MSSDIRFFTIEQFDKAFDEAVKDVGSMYLASGGSIDTLKAFLSATASIKTLVRSNLEGKK